MKIKKFKGYFSALVFFVISFSCFFSGHAVGQPKTMISFMGAPGAGKGTLAGKCIQELKFISLSVGNILREEIAKGTLLGKKAECIKEGKLVSDELVIEIVESWLTDNLDKADTLIFDGFPRTVHQAELFLNLLHTKFNNRLFRVMDLNVSDETAVQRIADRLVCEKCQEPESRALLKDATNLVCGMCGGKLIKREDDKEEVVRNRLKVHAEHAKLLLDVYNKANVKIDCIAVENENPQQVFEAFKVILGIESIITAPLMLNITSG